jgi:hypothetical protein
MKPPFRKLPFDLLTYLFISFCVLVWVSGEPLIPGTSLYPDPIADKFRMVQAAKARWLAQQPLHYRMAVTDGNCTYDVEVFAEKVIYKYQNSCQKKDVTVSTIFEQLENDTKEIIWGGNGFGCDVMVVSFSFDPTWAYPQKIEYSQEWATVANIGELAYRNVHPLIAVGRYCTLLGWVRLPTYITSFRLLPKPIEF